MRRSFLAATLGVVATALIVISAGAAAETAGTWSQYPNGATKYQARCSSRSTPRIRATGPPRARARSR